MHFYTLLNDAVIDKEGCIFYLSSGLRKFSQTNYTNTIGIGVNKILRGPTTSPRSSGIWKHALTNNKHVFEIITSTSVRAETSPPEHLNLATKVDSFQEFGNPAFYSRR